MSLLIAAAQALCYDAHKGQLDDCGKPYHKHPEAVAEILMMVAPEDEALIAAGYLHDVLESTKVTYEDLRNIFEQDIADLVREVTDTGEKNCFPNLHTKRGIMLKFADRLHNLSRMECWNEARQKRYLEKSKFWKGAK